MIRAAMVAFAIMAAGCMPSITPAQLFAAQLIAATDRLADEAIRIGWRPDQAAQAATAARAIAETLATRFPDGKRIGTAVAVLDAALAGLGAGPGLAGAAREAQTALLNLRIDLARRHRILIPDLRILSAEANP